MSYFVFPDTRRNEKNELTVHKRTDELKQFVNDERMKVDREKEKEEERKRQEKEDERLRQDRKKESERAEREKEQERTEQERERAYELERIKLEKEVEVQRICSEHEFKMAEMRAANTDQDTESDEDGGQGDHRRNGSRASAMKALKLPPFNEDKDDLDAYIIRFERACVTFEVRPEHWSTQLARLLQGMSLEVYQRLPDRYDVLKAQLLKRFRVTEGGYRKKLKNSKLELSETADQFVERLRHYLIKWCEMVGYQGTQRI